MSVRPFFGLLLAMGLAGCGGTATVYKGTMTTTQSFNGASQTTTTTGQSIVIYSGGEGGALLVDLGSIIVSMTRSGDALTAGANQSVQETDSTSTSVTTVSAGSGTLNAQGLSLNLTGTTSQTSGGTTQNLSYTLAFTGTKI